ncbi:MAG: hypothetical protein K2K89_10745 [Ruminococcus sp.]|nr:hypothetical protein [Ruminococcus sp.]
MKKRNVLLSALILAVMTLSPMASFADDTGGEEPQASTSATQEEAPETTKPAVKGFPGGNTIDVSVSRASSYVVTIPAGKQEFESGKQFEVSVSAVLGYNRAVVVSVESENGWKLADKKDTTKSHAIEYTMSVNGAVMTEGVNNILEVPYNQSGHRSSVTLVAGEVGTPQLAGTYSDTLTFTVSETDIGELTILGRTPSTDPTTQDPQLQIPTAPSDSGE